MPRSVIREHYATGHHFDLRLERDGTRETGEFDEKMVNARFAGNRPDGRHAILRTGGKNRPVHKMKPSGGARD